MLDLNNVMRKNMNSMSSLVGSRPAAAALLGRRPIAKSRQLKSQAGFSLIEMLIACLLITIIMGSIFLQIRQAQLSSAVEQVKLDLFQESREFMDQLSRDLRAAGYPNPHNFVVNPVSPTYIEPYSPQEAVGLVKIDVGTLWFESSVDGCSSTASGSTCNVSVIRYDLVTTGPGCPCLRRSQTPKADSPPADPVSGQSEVQQTEVQNILNGTTGDPIFQAYYSDGTPVPSMDMNADCSGGQCLANVNTVAIILKVQSPYTDPTGQKPTTTLMSTVRLNNCSSAYLGGLNTVMGCR